MSQNERIESLISGSVLASPPDLLFRIINSLNSQMTNRQISEIIGHDQSISAQIMRLANSSFFGFKGQVSTLDRAITVLGTKMVLNIALASFLVAKTGKIKLCNLDLNAFWLHSFLVAAFVRELAPSFGMNQNEAYVAGLLHDTGRLILYSQPQEPVDLFEAPHTREEIEAYEQEQWGVTSRELTVALLERWNIPEQMVQAVSQHSTPLNAAPLGKALFLANEFANTATDPQQKAALTYDLLQELLESLAMPEWTFRECAHRLPGVAVKGRQIMATILKGEGQSGTLVGDKDATVICQASPCLSEVLLLLLGMNVDCYTLEQLHQLDKEHREAAGKEADHAGRGGFLASLFRLNRSSKPHGVAKRATRAVRWRRITIFDDVDGVAVPESTRVYRVSREAMPAEEDTVPFFFTAADFAPKEPAEEPDESADSADAEPEPEA